MDKNDIKIWSDLTFKTESYRKNFDLVTKDENIITEYAGTISLLRLAEQKIPLIVGEYSFSVLNIESGRVLDIDLEKLIKAHHVEDTYGELMQVIDEKYVDLNQFKKVILLHTLILRADYRKHGITEEFIETIYRDFYDKNIAIIALIKPFQDNPIDADYYLERKAVQLKEKIVLGYTVREVPAVEYYSLKDLIEKTDGEINTYKLFSVAQKCGFNRIGNSFLFRYSPDKTINRMREKYQYLYEKE